MTRAMATGDIRGRRDREIVEQFQKPRLYVTGKNMDIDLENSRGKRKAR